MSVWEVGGLWSVDVESLETLSFEPAWRMVVCVFGESRLEVACIGVPTFDSATQPRSAPDFLRMLSLTHS